ncbi:histidine kinase dimerization/phosphoacceptor domain -containing protein [Candidatus Cloacimonadota bacterium]
MDTISKTAFDEKLNFLSLQFKDRDLEHSFRNFCKEGTSNYIRYVILIVIFFYGFFAVLDAFLVPQFKIYLWFIRFILVLPMALVMLIASGYDSFKKNMYALLSIFSIISGLGIIAMIAIAPPPVSTYYYAALMIILIFNYNFLKLPFIWATIVGMILSGLYVLTILVIQPIPVTDFINNSFFLITTNFICMFSNYFINYNNRKNFYLQHMLNDNNQKLISVNKDLESELKKRTQEIQSTYDKLSSSETYHRHILENLGEGVAVVDLNENISFANAAAEKIFGVGSGKLIGRNLIEFTTSESLQTIQSESEKITAGITAEYEIEIIPENQENIYLAVTARPEYDDSGNISGILGIYRDISKRKEIEDEMKLRLDYELLLSSISHRFFGVYEFSKSVLETLAEFGDFIKASHVFLYEINKKKGLLLKNHVWSSGVKGSTSDDQQEIDLKDLPLILKKITENKVLDFCKEKDKALISESELLFQKSWSSTIILPVMVNNELMALTGFNYQGEGCLWSDKYMALVKVLADIFGYAYERKNFEMLIRNQLNEKESLLKEIHHRVKNNMQIITSIIRLQTRFLTNINIDEILLNFQNRMQTMTQAYNKVFLSGSFTKIDFERYLSSLIIDLYYSMKISQKNVKLDTDIDKVELDINIVIPLGLIINEILTNSLKHAFPNNTEGLISISFKELGNEEFFLKIVDNGIGIPENFNFVQADSLGALLINILSEQIKAEVSIENENGTIFTLKFNNLVLKTFSEF